jgi:DNA adenine methylase
MHRLRAPIQWFGGKGNLLKKLLPLIPYDKVYIEPYFGAGSIFWNRKPSPCEVINDLNEDLINLMRYLQSPLKTMKLKRKLAATLYSKSEFCKARRILISSTNKFERAWAFYVCFNQGFSGKATCDSNWGRGFTSCRGMGRQVSAWWTRFELFPSWHNRMARAQIDCKDAIECIKYWDSDHSVFYLDPPYPQGVRKFSNTDYIHDCDDNHHKLLINTITNIKAAATLSGYNNDIYSALNTTGWTKFEFTTACHAAGRTRNSGLQGKGVACNKVPRIECVWINEKAKFLLQKAQRQLAVWKQVNYV